MEDNILRGVELVSATAGSVAAVLISGWRLAVRMTRHEEKQIARDIAQDVKILSSQTVLDRIIARLEVFQLDLANHEREDKKVHSQVQGLYMRTERADEDRKTILEKLDRLEQRHTEVMASLSELRALLFRQHPKGSP